MRVSIFLFATLAMSVSSTPLYVWGALGHQAICDATWRASHQDMRKELSAAAKRMGYKTFAGACLWADKIRNKKAYAWSKPLHYMNTKRHDKTVERSACQPVFDRKLRCVLSAIAYYHRRWRDKSKTQKERDQALLMMSHFVGDLHQPLHVAYADDLGGNRKRVVFQGKLTSLHGLWDSDILYCGTRASWRNLGKQLYRQHRRYQQESQSLKYDLMQASQGDFAFLQQWANESFAVTQRIYEDKRKRLPEGYCQQFYPVAITQLTLASIRLAALLDGRHITGNHSGDNAGDKVQSATNLTSKFSDLWKSTLTLQP